MNKELTREETPEHLLTVLQAYLEDDLNEQRFPQALEYLESWKVSLLQEERQRVKKIVMEKTGGLALTALEACAKHLLKEHLGIGE
jgi:hypothetical protein